MQTHEKTMRKMIGLLDTQALREGYTPTSLEGVQLVRLSRPVPRAPVIYNPSIVIVGQGTKKGYLGEEQFTYDADNYLVLAVPIPFECETWLASADQPLLSVSIGIDHKLLGELLLDMKEFMPQPELPRGIHTSPTTPELRDAALRLLECLQNPMESHILGRQIVREIIFRVLTGPQGWSLRAMMEINGSYTQIGRALQIIHQRYDQELDVETLARAANMSLSGFHQTFKTVTTASPIQYLKSVRLHKARLLMVQDGVTASSAAAQVGYASPSQFSREFKRFFGATPMDETHKMRDFSFSAPLRPGQLAAGA